MHRVGATYILARGRERQSSVSKVAAAGGRERRRDERDGKIFKKVERKKDGPLYELN